MNQHLSKSLLVLAGISLLVCTSQATRASLVNNVAVIVNTGSTNTIGYRIYVSPSGAANYVDGKGYGQAQLPEKLTETFFDDLKVAQPLSTLPVQLGCVKSVSFGTTTYLELGAFESPDVSCPGSIKAQHIYNDVIVIAKALNVKNVPNSQGKPLPAQNF